MFGMFKAGVHSQDGIIPPAAPTNAILYDYGGLNTDTDWDDNSSGASQEDLFRIEVRVNGGVWQAHDTNLPDDTYTYIYGGDYGATTGDTLQFRVRAENAAGNSTWALSNIVILSV